MATGTDELLVIARFLLSGGVVVAAAAVAGCDDEVSLLVCDMLFVFICLKKLNV
jgi:hypothetical protein